MVPTESLMDPTDWMVGYFSFWERSTEPHPEGSAIDFFKRFKEEVQSNFDSYQLPVITLLPRTLPRKRCAWCSKRSTQAG